MRDLAEAVIRKYYGVSPLGITSLGGGWYGRVFLAEMSGIPTKAVVKIHLFPDLAGKEARQIELLASYAIVRMPEVFFVHAASSDIPYDVIVMEYIPGVNAGNQEIGEIDENSRTFIAEQMIDNLLAFHATINPAGFGEIDAVSFEPDWRKWYKAKADESTAKAESLYAGGKITMEVFSIVQKAHMLYDEIFYLPITEARLIHGDYNPWNILLDEKKARVAAVIDPLNCCFADSEKDLYQLNHANGKDYKLLDIYAGKKPLSENVFLKLSFYELFEHITHFYDTNVEIDQPFLSDLSNRLERQMRDFKLL